MGIKNHNLFGMLSSIKYYIGFKSFITYVYYYYFFSLDQSFILPLSIKWSVNILDSLTCKARFQIVSEDSPLHVPLLRKYV